MMPFDPMAVAADWLDAYRAARINQIVGMYSPNAVVVCACQGRKIIPGREEIAAYWLHRFSAIPHLSWRSWRCMAVVVSYRISSGIVQALLNVAENGLMTRSRCGPM
jgi:hypothetical protein